MHVSVVIYGCYSICIAALTGKQTTRKASRLNKKNALNFAGVSRQQFYDIRLGLVFRLLPPQNRLFTIKKERRFWARIDIHALWQNVGRPNPDRKSVAHHITVKPLF
jgi:hypothetical protein